VRNVTLQIIFNIIFLISFLLSVLPLNVSIVDPMEPFSISRAAIIECRSVGSRPPAIITWWKRGKFMGKATEEVNQHISVSN
jgi:hypothetical protein